MARQQITVDTITPTSCSESSGPFYDVTYPNSGSSWSQKGADIDGEANDVYGSDASLSSDGTIVAIGAGTTGGHVAVYAWNGNAWVQRGADIDGEAAEDRASICSLSSDGTIVAIGAWGNDDGGTYAGHVRVYAWSGSAWVQRGADIDGEAAQDYSGRSVSLSDDGTIVAIAAYLNDGGGNASGHVRVYEWNSGTSAWDQKGADIDGEAADDYSGWSVSLNGDGTIVAIGAIRNDGGGAESGHVRVYEYSGSSWSQKGADIDGEAANDWSGRSVSLSSDGDIVAIGANLNDGGGSNAGHVRVYEYGGSSWSQKGADIDGEATLDQSGESVSLSDDGTIVAIASEYNDGAGTNAGHVRVYAWSGSAWVQRGADIDGEAAQDYSGRSVSLSSDGSIVAIGAYGNDGGGTNAGHVRVYQSDNAVGMQVGDWVYVNHEEAGNDGNVLSVYTYQVTAIVDADTLTLKWISSTNGYVDDSPCDLCDGTGSSASCGGKAPHTFKRDLGSAYLMFVD